MFSGLKKNKFFSRLDVRLTSSVTVILFMLSIGLFAFCYTRLESLLDKQVDRILVDEIQELADDITEEHTILEGCKQFESDVSRRKYYPFDFRVFTPAGELIYQSKKAAKIPFPNPKLQQEAGAVPMPDKGTKYKLYEHKLNINNVRDLYVQMITEKRQDRELLERFYQNLLLAIPVVIVLSLACGMFVANKPRKIIKNIARVTSRISSQNLKERLPLPTANDEVQELTITINSMIERLQKSFNEIRQFTVAVSHELRNPLFALKGSIEVMLSERRTIDECRLSMAECLNRVNSLIKMVNNLFLISRFDLKKIILDMTIFNVREMLMGLREFFLPMAEEKQLQLVCGQCEDATISADKSRILQLLSNLLENAIKFTPAGGRVTLSLLLNNQHVIIRVSDTGIGIPENQIPNVFDRFYQVDPSRSGHEHGAGLGLHICKQIVEAHGGTIGVEPNKNKGVTFTAILPSNAKT